MTNRISSTMPKAAIVSTMINQRHPDQSYATTGRDGGAKVGVSPDRADLCRSLFRFPSTTWAIAGGKTAGRGSDYFHGAIDSVYAFGGVLSDEEIGNLAA
ncbi:LamG domain-containing protein [Fodinicola feengrottensis]|uniref:Uncharacterized protein n=1 Tax=Fodinicola feengrottensis TaxID=435914 RepID=A0ABN2IEH4_9ACTN|nr:LamG domain-containing protein [Fodinicola feengrottensis]